MFEECVSETKILIADVFDKSKYSRTDILSHLKNAIISINDVKGIMSTRLMKYAFRPMSASDPTVIDSGIYENDSNVKMDFQLEAVDTTQEAKVETIARYVVDKQVALVAIYWNLEGSSLEPTIDISFDKDVENGTSLRGTFLVDDSRINPIENGVMFDTSMIVSRTFSIKWTIPANSDYKIKDTIAKIFLVDSSMFVNNQYDIARIAASNILKNEALAAAKDGQAESYTSFLTARAKELVEDIQGKIGAGISPVSSAGSMKHDYDRNKFADRAFDSVAADGDWVEVVGNEIIGRTIRYVD